MSSPKTTKLYSRTYRLSTYMDDAPRNALGLVIPNSYLVKSINQIKGYPYSEESPADLFKCVDEQANKIEELKNKVKNLEEREDEWKRKLDQRDQEWKKKLDQRDQEWKKKLDQRDQEWKEFFEEKDEEWKKKTQKLISEALEQQKRSIRGSSLTSQVMEENLPKEQ